MIPGRHFEQQDAGVKLSVCPDAGVKLSVCPDAGVKLSVCPDVENVMNFSESTSLATSGKSSTLSMRHHAATGARVQLQLDHEPYHVLMAIPCLLYGMV